MSRSQARLKEVRKITDPFTGQEVEIRDDLALRLRGRYAVGPTLQNGEPEFGWREFGAPAIQIEAANEIERLRKILKLARDDLTLIVAKHAIGKDRTVSRVAKYLNAECRRPQ